MHCDGSSSCQPRGGKWRSDCALRYITGATALKARGELPDRSARARSAANPFGNLVNYVRYVLIEVLETEYLTVIGELVVVLDGLEFVSTSV